MDAVVVEDLRKSYGATHRGRGELTVRYGEIFSLLGPNGAGKTTVLEILEGYRADDEGKVLVAGFDPGDRRTGRQLREQDRPGAPGACGRACLTVRESVSRNAGYYPDPRDVGEVIGLVGLTGKEKSKVRALCGGQKRRLDLALGIIGNPRVLFLDEPTTASTRARGARRLGGHQGASRPGRHDPVAPPTLDKTRLAEPGRRPLRRRGGRKETPATLGGRDPARARISSPSPAAIPRRTSGPGRCRRDGRLVVEADQPPSCCTG